MEQSEYKYFTITPFDLFRDGHGSGVAIDSTNRLTLASSSSLAGGGPLATPIGMAVDHADILFFIDRTTGFLYYLCPGNTKPVRIPCIGGLGTEACRFQFVPRTDQQYRRLWEPDCDNTTLLSQQTTTTGEIPFFGGIAVNRQYIALSDSGNRRVQCFFRRSLQLSYIIDASALQQMGCKGNWDNFAPWDCVIDSFGDLYVIDLSSKALLRISRRGSYAVRMGQDALIDPVSLFLDASDTLYVLDRGASAIIKKTFGPAGTWSQVVSLKSIIGEGNRALGIAVDRRSTIYAGECGCNDDHKFHYWNSDGEYAGTFSNTFGLCKRMALGPGASIYAECEKYGIVKLNDENGFVTEGYFFSKIFDGGARMTCWHRIVADAKLYRGTSLGIDYVADDNRNQIEQPWKLDASRWQTLFNVYGEDATNPDALMSKVVGRYVAIRVRLTGNGTNSPLLRRIKITYPHESYLRYIPAIYKDDPIGRDLTDRFLSLFESFNMDMDEEIGAVTRFFDPASTRSDFLPWLASWFGIVQDQNWPEKKFRELLSRSYSLFRQRGTIGGLTAVITLYTGSTVTIIEHYRYLRPMVLGADLRVGMTTIVGKKFTVPLVIEETSTIGSFALIEVEEPPEMPFLADAYDFTVTVGATDMTTDQKACLVRIIEHEKPAHTRYLLRISGEGSPRIGTALTGIDTRLTHAYMPMETGTVGRIGIDSVIGTRYPISGIYGACSQIGMTTYLY